MRDKEEFIKGILEVAKKNLENYEHLLQVLFLDTDKGIITIGLVGVSKDNMNYTLGHAGKEFAQKGIKINTVFLLSDATSRTFPMEMKYKILEDNISKADIFKNAIETADAIILLDWDLINDHQEVTIQYYHKDEKDEKAEKDEKDEKNIIKNIIFDGVPVRLENAVINMLDSFVYNYRSLQSENNQKI